MDIDDSSLLTNVKTGKYLDFPSIQSNLTTFDCYNKGIGVDYSILSLFWAYDKNRKTISNKKYPAYCLETDEYSTKFKVKPCNGSFK